MGQNYEKALEYHKLLFSKLFISLKNLNMEFSSGTFNPVICAIIYVSKEYEAMLKGTPSPISALL